MKKKISVLEAIIKIRNIPTTKLEQKLLLPKGYIKKVIDGKIMMKPITLFKLLEELDITLEQYGQLNKKTKELCEDSTISNEIRWQKLLTEIFVICPLSSIEEKNKSHKKN